MQKAKQISKSVLRDIFIICLILGVFGAVIVGWSVSPMRYINRKTAYLSYGFPKEVYHFDAIGHGKDYDSIHIFKLKEWDGKRFLRYLKDQENWNPLPVDQKAAKKHLLCDVEFDEHMRGMLGAEGGYWIISPEKNLFCVYDQSEYMLYIRTASSYTHYKWNETGKNL